MRNKKMQQVCRIGFINYNKFRKSNKWNDSYSKENISFRKY